MRNSLTSLSFIVFVLALVAWAAVWFLFTDVGTRLQNRSEALSTASVVSTQQTNALALHSIVAETATQRAQLDSSVTTDVVGIANTINAAGKSSGAQTTIGSTVVVASGNTTSGVNEVEFLVQSTGSFQQIWRAAQLFETLPLPSTVSELDFEQLPNSGKGLAPWQLTVHIDVLTSAQVSS